MENTMDTTDKAVYRRGRSTYYGIVLIDGKLACEQCRTIEPDCTIVMHMDSVKSYGWAGTCDTCGNGIRIETQRTKEDRRLWEG